MPHTRHAARLVACALAASSLCALGGCGAELELGETTLETVCVRADRLPFDGAGRASATIAVDELAQRTLADNASARLSSLSLRPAPDAELPAIDGVRLELRGNGGLADVLLVDEDVAAAPTVRVDAAGDQNLVPYLDAPPLVFTLAVTGGLPVGGFFAGLDVCFELDHVVVDDGTE
jgi:hypothetical protein